eukprot:11450537-Alexandrium_andersonii.AAC.1
MDRPRSTKLTLDSKCFHLYSSGMFGGVPHTSAADWSARARLAASLSQHPGTHQRTRSLASQVLFQKSRIDSRVCRSRSWHA